MLGRPINSQCLLILILKNTNQIIFNIKQNVHLKNISSLLMCSFEMLGIQYSWREFQETVLLKYISFTYVLIIKL